MTQPYYQIPPGQYVPPPQKKANWFGFLVSAILVIFSFGFLYYLVSYPLFGHLPLVGFIYKEYSSVSEVYKGAALGDRIKVTVNAKLIQPKDGTIDISDPNSNGVVFRLPKENKSNIKVFPGRNIVYGYITERRGLTIYCDVEEIQI